MKLDGYSFGMVFINHLIPTRSSSSEYCEAVRPDIKSASTVGYALRTFLGFGPENWYAMRTRL
jgi:hypothetical protein